MFNGCRYLRTTGDLGNWNMTNNDFATSMFAGCKNLKSTNFNKWDVNLPQMVMSNMFKGCNKNIISKWYK